MTKNTHSKVPAVLLKKEDTAIIDKLIITDPTNTKKHDTHDFIDISKYTSMKNESNQSILTMFPDLEMGMDIIINSTLSPNNMVDSELLLSIQDLPLPIEVSNIIISYIDKYINKEYMIQDNLEEMLLESYYTKGSYVTAVIPEASLSEIVNFKDYDKTNISIENLGLDSNKNILEDTKYSVSIEELIINKVTHKNVKVENDLISFTDNPSILQYKSIAKSVTTHNVSNVYTSSNEDKETYKLDEIFKDYLKNDDELVKDTIYVKDKNSTERASIGKPLVIKIPTESVIPIHVPGDPKEHIGYFILLNEQGVPLTHNDEWSKTDEDKRLDALTKNTLTNRSSNNLSNFIGNIPTLSDMEHIYSEIFNKEIQQVLNNSAYGGISEVSNINHIYSTMLYRALRKQRTRILFLDKSVVSYMVFKYRENGTGKSQLERLSTISSLRAITNMTRVMANIKNSIPNTNIDVKLDEDDPDPEKSVEMVIDEVTKSRALQIPVGLQNMNDLVEWSRKVGYKFNFKHDTRLPDMDIDFRDVIGDRAEPDTELDEKYKKDMINGIGLTPEKLDSAYSGRFATTEILNDIILVKKITKIQKRFEILLTNHIRLILSNDYKFSEEISKLFTNNLSKIRTVSKRKSDVDNKILKYKKRFLEYLVRTTISNITVKLPRPEFKEEDNLNKHFKDYKDAVEEYVEILFSTEAFPDVLVGEIANDLDEFKTAITNTLLRKWATENNYLTEVLEIVNDGKEVSSGILEEYGDYSEMISKILLKFMKKNAKLKKKNDKAYDKISDTPMEEIDDEDDGFESEEGDDKGTPPTDNKKEKDIGNPPKVKID